MQPVDTPQQVRSWYGLPGEIVIEHDYWHLVKVASLPLPHPPLVNLFIRRGLPAEERRRLSYWHEFGHLQTLPIAVLHAAWLLSFRSWRRLPWRRRLWRLGAMFLAHEAVWELASEGYVVGKTGRDYRQIYRQHPNRWLALFWTGMSGLALVASWFAARAAPGESATHTKHTTGEA
jgi:hypothetical protein